MIKLIALDLDNTLLEKDNTIAPETLNLLKECASKGITIVLATGRLFHSAKKYADLIGPETKIICYNGCLITESNGMPLFTSFLDTDIMRKVVDFTRLHGLYCQFYEDHNILVEKITEGTTIDPDLKNTHAIEVGDFDSHLFVPSPKAMIVASPDTVPKYQNMLNDHLGGKAYLAQSQPYLIEIMPEGINKASSLSLLCEKLEIPRHQTMAFGDNTNDLEMVSWAGIGVAVANSVEQLKIAADYVCCRERSLGVAEAIKKFIFL